MTIKDYLADHIPNGANLNLIIVQVFFLKFAAFRIWKFSRIFFSEIELAIV
jgi:hypothetical protein